MWCWCILLMFFYSLVIAQSLRIHIICSDFLCVWQAVVLVKHVWTSDAKSLDFHEMTVILFIKCERLHSPMKTEFFPMSWCKILLTVTPGLLFLPKIHHVFNAQNMYGCVFSLFVLQLHKLTIPLNSLCAQTACVCLWVEVLWEMSWVFKHYMPWLPWLSSY